MIERHVTFNVIPGKAGAFEALFETAYSSAMASQPGFVSATLFKEQKKAAFYQRGIRFQNLETAAAWRDSTDHQALSPAIKALYTASSVQAYDVITQKGKD
jgi:antibiotic biosynthesis monooxygenase (ABM) superfamily enzyme